MNAIVGIWDLTLKTPIGSLAVVYTFTDTAGTVAGTAEGSGETVPLTDIASTATADGQQVTWRQSVTRPLRLNLDFDVTVVGDTLSGRSRAGRLPASSVSGTRRSS
ncbi:hypothetical protein [Plantactinospora soyae]|uniref:Uncharacterized protein n=1 Tax=Plantactinospora soyae TaxID=1544732 RepID=A0A927M7Q3_9ACTN|nr:hypothetical protein [Plantactinospora soyae]MBE1488435.1 hypothetical protein [Plantactinospora soyae]